MPQPRLKYFFILVILYVSEHEVVSQNALSQIYHSLQMNQPELFELDSNYPNQELRDRDWWDSTSQEEGTEPLTKFDPNRKSRRFLNLSIAVSSVYQGLILSNGMTTKRTLGTPPMTYEQLERTPLGMAFPFLFTGGMSIGAYLLNNQKPIQPGLGRMYLYGSFMGLVHGLILTRAFGNTTSGDYYKYSAYIGGLTSLAEGFWLTHFARKNHLTLHETNFAIFSSFYSGLFGALAGNIVSKEEDLDKGISLGLTAGSIGGIYLSRYLNSKRAITSGDLIIINSAAATGFLVGKTIDWFSSDRLTQSLGYVTSIGTALIGSYILTGHHTFSDTDGLKIIGGTCLGVLLGVPVSVVMSSDETHNAIFPMVSGAILGWLGTTFLIMKRSYQNDRILFKMKKNSNQFHFNFNPTGLVLNLRDQDDQLRMMQSGVSMDLVQLQYRF